MKEKAAPSRMTRESSYFAKRGGIRGLCKKLSKIKGLGVINHGARSLKRMGKLIESLILVATYHTIVVLSVKQPKCFYIFMLINNRVYFNLLR